MERQIDRSVESLRLKVIQEELNVKEMMADSLYQIKEYPKALELYKKILDKQENYKMDINFSKDIKSKYDKTEEIIVKIPLKKERRLADDKSARKVINQITISSNSFKNRLAWWNKKFKSKFEHCVSFIQNETSILVSKLDSIYTTNNIDINDLSCCKWSKEDEKTTFFIFKINNQYDLYENLRKNVEYINDSNEEDKIDIFKNTDDISLLISKFAKQSLGSFE
jgi:hypothetical protein